MNWPDYSVPTDWLQKLITYMKSRNIPYTNFKGVPLILVSKNSGILKALWKTLSVPKPFVQSYLGNSISNDLKNFLEKIGVYFVVDSDSEIGALVQSGCVQYPDPNSLVTQMSQNQGPLLQSYPKGNGDLNEEICSILSRYHLGIPGFFRGLPLFKTVGGRFVGAENCVVVQQGDLPQEWKDSYGNVVIQNISNQPLIHKLDIKLWTYEDVCMDLFTARMLPSKDILSLSEAVLLKLQTSLSSNLQSLAVQHVRVKSDNNSVRRPCELFEKTEELSSLFLGEHDRFPDSNYNVSTLKRIGLKSVHNVSAIDVNQSIKAIQKMTSQGKDVIMMKVNSILNTMKQNNLVGSVNYNNGPWIPVEREAPRDYPKLMLWHGATRSIISNTVSLQFPSDVFLPRYQYLVGSHKFILSSEVTGSFESCFQGTSYVDYNIGVRDAITQLENLQKSYFFEKANAESMVKIIYKFISKQQTVLQEFPVWHGNGFTTHHRIIMTNKKMINVSPYYFKPPEFVRDMIGSHLTRLGCQDEGFQVYLKTLQEIAAKYNGASDTLFSVGSLSDTELALRLVKDLAMNFLKEVETNRTSIFVPVEASSLKLAQLDSCNYLDFDSETKFKTSSSDNIVHRRLSGELARQLGIPNLVCKIFQGSENSLFEPWGQHQEPLTKNLQSILEGYEDGMAIIKELIQNADDAGATEVSLLYDKRTNEAFKGKLISPKMSEWQGPALWVHNNKEFTETDFKNITKLNAGTKKGEATKIGKFGLGFNAVYHLTDVPSILSGSSLVIFDPHMKYLGAALKRGEPGIRIGLHDRVSEISKFEDQFSIFEGVFGAHINMDPSAKCQAYEGSLFRFPLRNENCAKTSEIKKLHYSEPEVVKLLAKIEESVDVLLLFTQNVVKFSVYFLDADTQDPCEKILFLSTQKEGAASIKSVVEHANSQLLGFPLLLWGQQVQKNHVTNEIQLSTTNLDGNKSINNWVVHSRDGSQATYQFASQNMNDGLLPYCSIAFQTQEGNTNKSKQVDGHLFYFLPLPIRSGLPGHVNAAFKISKDRLSLKYHTVDEKNYNAKTQTNWNDLIGADIGEAYYQVLIYFKNKRIAIDDFYDLFPKRKDVLSQHLAKMCVSKLLKLCKDGGTEIFPVTDDGNLWKTWANLQIPNFDIPRSITKACLCLVNWYFNSINSPVYCVELPEKLDVLLQCFSYKSKLALLKWDYVLQTVENCLNDPNFPSESRNEVMFYLLENNSLGETNLVNLPCIPTKPNGKLRRPNELIREQSKVSKLYTIDDEVFPDVGSRHLRYLQNLGMKDNLLSIEMVIDRAESMSEQGFSMEKIELLLDQISSIALINFNSSQLERLRNCKFLPVLAKPKNSFFTSWFGSNIKLSEPASTFSGEFGDVVSCSQVICSIQLPFKSKEILQLQCQPSVNDLLVQLMELLENYDEKRDADFKSILKNIVQALAKAPSISTEFGNLLRRLKFVVSDDERLYCADQIFEHVLFPVSGKIQTLHPAYQGEKYVMDFLEKIGVRSLPSLENYVKVIKDLHNTQQDRPLSVKHLKEICRLVPYLSENQNNPTLTDALYLPDQKMVLHPITSLCYNDQDWLPEENDVFYVNSEITKKHAVALGIKSRRTDSFLKKADLLTENWNQFGQSEDLTTRIKNLIQGYSEPLDVFKEMIQNADDAGATQIQFILDHRQHGTTKTISEKWDNLQGPALLIANNGEFTEADFKGIQKLGLGSKRGDPLKTGKYGVGFNTVYSLTDCPILLTNIHDSSTGEDKKDVMCIFDPHLKFADGATIDKPGCCFENAREFLGPYKDIKKSFMLEDKDLASQTLLRLVLRNEVTAKDSKISEDVVDIGQLSETLSKLNKYGDEFLLFLSNIKSITIKIISAEGVEIKDKICIELYDTLERQLEETQSVVQIYAKPDNDVQDLYDAHVLLHRKHCVRRFKEGRFTSSYHWDVFEQVGFSDIHNINDEVFSVLEKREYKLIPKGGVAKPSKDSVCKGCQYLGKGESKANHSITRRSLFCTLPLEAETGIEGIINGNFALESSVRRSLYNSEGIKKQWNDAILNNCVLPCFIEHLVFTRKCIDGKYQLFKNESASRTFKKIDEIHLPEYLSKCQEIDHFYKMFPTKAESTDQYFQEFTDAFYKKIATTGESLLCVHKPGEVRFYNTKEFLLYQNIKNQSATETNLLKVLKLVNLRVDALPGRISRGFEDVELPLNLATPDNVRIRLMEEKDLVFPRRQTRSNIAKTNLKTVANVMTLLKFCLKREEDKNGVIPLGGLPLCILQDETLSFFRQDSPVFLTNFTSLFNEQTSKFVHKLAYYTLKMAHVDQLCFKDFDLDDFRQMMSVDSELQHLVNPPDELLPLKHTYSKEFQIPWLSSCWRFIESQLTGGVTIEIQNSTKDEKKVIKYELLDKIKDICLLLVEKHDGNEKALLPIRKRKCIPYKTDDDDAIAQWMFDFLTKECQSFEPSTHCLEKKKSQEIYSTELLRNHLFGRPNNFTDIVNCMEYSLNMGEPLNFKLELKTTEELLEKLQSLVTDGIDEECKHDLTSLPIFESFDHRLTTGHGDVYTLSMSLLPDGGLSLLERKYGIKLLSNQDSLKKLYQFLGFKSTDLIPFFIRFVVPSLESFSNEDTVKCIKQIMGHVEKSDELKRMLMNACFVIAEDGKRKLCSEVYDFSNQLFVEMEPEENFPCRKIYDKSTWLKFLRKMGMIKTADQINLLKYARMIEAEKDQKRFIKKSRLLCQSFITRADKFQDEAFLQEFSLIEFVQPSEKNDPLMKSFNSSVDRISFEASVTPDCFDLVWTSKFVLPNYAFNAPISKEQSCCLSEKSMMALGILTKKSLDVNSVKLNLEKLTHSMESLEQTDSMTCKLIKKEHRETYERILTAAYDFIENEGKPKKGIEILKDLPFIICGQKGCYIDQPGQCISDQSSYRYMAPYINIVPNELGKYFAKFEELGFCKDPGLSHFWSVLLQIKQSAADKYLSHNDRSKATEALKHLSTELVAKGPHEISKFYIQLEVKELYLPTVTFKNVDDVKMTLASQCFIVKDFSLRERLMEFDQPLVIFGQDDSYTTNHRLLEHLPKAMRPRVLRTFLEEALVDSIASSTQNANRREKETKDVDKNFRKRIKSAEFLASLQRLAKHEGIKNLDESLIKRITSDVRAVIVDSLQTCLKYQGVKIEKSSVSKDVFIVMSNDDASLMIYLKESCEMSSVASQISEKMLSLLGQPFKDTKTINSFTQLLTKERKEMSKYLDSMEITKETIDFDFFNSGRLPTLGDEVPSCKHFTLNLDLQSEFIIGDQVAYDKDGRGEFYIYAKVVDELDGDYVIIQIDEDEDPICVSRTLLFLFESYDKPRQPEETLKKQNGKETKNDGKAEDNEPPTKKPRIESEKSYEEITEEIREIMREMKTKDEAEQKRVLRRLYLKWHPDKNDNSELCTEVFKFIMNEQKKLNKSDYFEEYQNWDAQAKRDKDARTRYQQEFRRRNNFDRGSERNNNNSNSNSNSRHDNGAGNHGSSSSSSGANSSSSSSTGRGFTYHDFEPQENPQPVEAQRWLRQARHDLATATRMDPDLSEWVCHICHQVWVLYTF